MNRFYICCILVYGCLTSAANVLAAEEDNIHAIEEVLVTGLPLQQTRSESALPIHVLAGDALRENANSTLGDTLAQQTGLRSASFGSGVGRPVIRGQSSTRVRVLQNGTGTLDVSAVSPDHGNAVEPLIARQIEVIRGPATLLYGNGAIGGVVNVVDNRIPKTIEEESQLAVEYRHNTVNHGDVIASTLDAYNESFAWHLDFSLRDTSNTHIPGFASVEEHDEGEAEEEHEEREDTYGYIANSNQRAHNFAGGFAWIISESRLGFSVSHLQNNYGIPPGVHEHHPEEEEEPAEEEDHEDADIRLDIEQDRFEFEGERENIGFINKLDIQGNYTDYHHRELAHEGEGTLFSKQGYEIRSSAHLATNNKTVIGLQLQNTRFDNVGEEAYLPIVKQKSVGVFALYNVELVRWILETGLRVESETQETRACKESTTNWSASASGIYEIEADSQFVMSYTRSERAPAMEENYSNIDAQTCLVLDEPIAHFATGLIEIGNPDLVNETSGNFELSFRKNSGDIRGEFTVFQNVVDDYIYLDIVEIEEDTAYFTQRNAKFVGVEATLTLPVVRWRDSHMDLSLGGDYVAAEFSNANSTVRYLPRIPPARVNVELAWWSEALHVKLRIAENMQQDKLSTNESMTPAYTRVDLFSEYHWGSATIFLKLNNMLDEEIRDHTSYIKDAVPEAGRGVELGTRFYF